MRTIKWAVVAVVIIVIVIVLVLLLAIMSRAALAKLSTVAPHAVGPIYSRINLIGHNYFTYDNAQSIAAYALVNYLVANATSANISIATYASNPIRQVYLVNVSNYCYRCFSEQSVFQNLSSYLADYGLIFNSSSISMISMQNLSQVRNGSIVIVPSGLIPFPMLENYSQSIFMLLDRGDIVIYVGQAFNRSLGGNGVIFQTFQVSPSLADKLAAYSLVTAPMAQANASNLQAALSSKIFNKPSFFFSKGYLYNGISYVNSANGTMISFSNYSTSAWRNASSFAASLVSAISSAFWINMLAYGYENVTIGSSTVGVFTNSTAVPISSKSTLNNSYSVVRLAASNATATVYRVAAFRQKYISNGTIGLPSVVAEAQSVPVYVSLNSSSPIMLHIDLYNSNLTYVSSIPFQGQFPPGRIALVKYISFKMPSGTYIAVLRNATNGNYSAAIFSLAPITITPVVLDFKNSTFVFKISSDGMPVSNTSFSATLNGVYNTSGSIINGTLIYALPRGTIISYGKQVFKFNMFGETISYSTTYSKEVLHLPTFYIEFGVVVIAVVMLNLILKPPNRDEYYIDVPSFPSEKKDVVKVKASDIMNIFERVNYYYHWSYMPLTIGEIKNGVSQYIRYNNMPVSITSQNAQQILSQLINSGDVVSSHGYYAPASWVSLSKQNIEYLTVFRMLRDYCVSHAMLFTELNMEPDVDTIVTKAGRQAKVIIYAGGKMRRFEVDANTKTFILFIDDESKAEFENKLYRACTKEAEILKLSIDYGYVKLVSAENFDQFMF